MTSSVKSAQPISISEPASLETAVRCLFSRSTPCLAHLVKSPARVLPSELSRPRSSLNSRTDGGAAVGAAVSTAAVTTSPSFDWSGIWDLLQRLLHDIPGLASGLPEALQSAEPSLRGAVEAANQTAAMPGLAGHVTAIVTLGTSLYTIWRRYRMYKKGLS